jgi:hypothetical protein
MATLGHIIGGPVDSDYDGATLTADLASGDLVLQVDDAGDFDEDGSKRGAELLIDPDLDGEGVPDPSTGSVLGYDTYDDDAGTVALSAASTVTASSGDRVFILDPVSGRPTGRLTVMVATDDGDTTGDALKAYLDVALLESVGDVDLTDLAVDLDEDEDGQLYVAGFPGLTTRQGNLKFDQDETTAVGPGGVVELDLKYIPIENSEHLYVGGVYQRGAKWSRDQWTVSIPDDENRLRAGVPIAMEYAYTDPARKPPVVYSAPAWHAVAGTWGAYATSFLTSQPLPTGTEVGDLLVAVAVGEGDHAISDSRLTTIASDANMSIAVGYATDLSDLTCHVGGTNFPIDQFAGLEVLAVRGDGSGPLAYDPDKIAVADVGAHAALATIAGAGHGAILAVASGVVNGITLDWATYCPDYADWGGDSHTAVLGRFGYSSNNSPAAQNSPTNTTTLAAVIGLK